MTPAAADKQLTDTERRFADAIGLASERRAQAARAEREATQDIAALCVEARAAGVTMARLAEFVQVLSKDDNGDGPPKLRPVTRQAVDQLVAAFENRPRVPRKPRRRRSHDDSGTPGSAIKLDAFK